jgi:hypothetical protein
LGISQPPRKGKVTLWKIIEQSNKYLTTISSKHFTPQT